MKIHLCAIALLLGACASAPGPVPPALDPGPGQRELLRLFASGVQVYACRAAAVPPGAAWTFVAPEAQLVDAQGRAAGSHGAGPAWRAPDGSQVLGSVQARAEAPGHGAVPWLLLRTRSTGGAGVFERVTSIQRVGTRGGVAPADGCAADAIGRLVRVPYPAEYRFFVAG